MKEWLMTQFKVFQIVALGVQIALAAILPGCSEEVAKDLDPACSGSVSKGMPADGVEEARRKLLWEEFDLEPIVVVFKSGPQGPQSTTWTFTKRVSKKELVGESRSGFGYRIFAPTCVRFFEVYTVVHPPGVPGEMANAWWTRIIPPEFVLKRGLRRPSKKFYWDGFEYFRMHEDDPLGEYRIDVYVDGELLDTLVFEVTP